ncbi:MAG: response regulator [Candidatus Latescibacterota bacterium]
MPEERVDPDPGELWDQLQAETRKRPADQRAAAGPSPAARGRRVVLVADDSATVRHLVRSVVLQLGHSVVEAADGAQALDLARQQLPDLIVLDVHMPEMDGLTVLRQVRTDPRQANTPVIMLTIDADRQVIRAALGGRVSDYLVKPVSVPELRERLARYLGQGPAAD